MCVLALALSRTFAADRQPVEMIDDQHHVGRGRVAVAVDVVEPHRERDDRSSVCELSKRVDDGRPVQLVHNLKYVAGYDERVVVDVHRAQRVPPVSSPADSTDLDRGRAAAHGAIERAGAGRRVGQLPGAVELQTVARVGQHDQRVGRA